MMTTGRIRFFLVTALLCRLYCAVEAQAWNVAEDLLETAQYSVVVHDLSHDRQILDINSKKLCIPASVTKIITAAAALDQLGPDYRFETVLLYSGRKQVDGTLDGDVFLCASGDPTWGSSMKGAPSMQDVFQEIYRYLQDKDIHCVEGNIVINLAGYSRLSTPYYWAIQDVANYYGSGAYGVNINENTFTLKLAQNTVTGNAVDILGTTPDLPLEWISELVTGAPGSGDQAYIFAGSTSPTRIVHGSIPPGDGIFQIKGALPNPPAFFASELSNYLTEKGLDHSDIELSYERINRKSMKALGTLKSEKLSSLMNYTLAKSNNLFAEAAFLALAEGDRDQAIKKVENYLEDCGCVEPDFQLYDGSGLSRANYINAACLQKLLERLVKDNSGIPDYFPTTQEAGSLRSYAARVPTTAMRAKTGSMTGVRCISGYLRSQSGSLLSFTVLVNNPQGSVYALYQELSQFFSDLYKKH